jgi:hypothetical protein
MRAKGSTSCITVTLEELNQVLKPGAQVPINRQFAQALNLSGPAIKATTKNIAAKASQEEFATEVEL